GAEVAAAAKGLEGRKEEIKHREYLEEVVLIGQEVARVGAEIAKGGKEPPHGIKSEEEIRSLIATELAAAGGIKQQEPAAAALEEASKKVAQLQELLEEQQRKADVAGANVASKFQQLAGKISALERKQAQSTSAAAASAVASAASAENHTALPRAASLGGDADLLSGP
ncbi:hypothetical protein CLOM_g16419, partial [Closterium sp. NIES-68]